MTTTTRTVTTIHQAMQVKDANGYTVTLTPAEVKMMKNLGLNPVEILELRQNIYANSTTRR